MALTLQQRQLSKVIPVPFSKPEDTWAQTSMHDICSVPSTTRHNGAQATPPET